MGILSKIVGESRASFRRRSNRMIKNAEIHGKKTGNYDPYHSAQSYQGSMMDEYDDVWNSGKRAQVQSYQDFTGGGRTSGRSDVHIPDYIGKRRRKVGAGVVAVSAAGANKDALLGFDKGRYEK